MYQVLYRKWRPQTFSDVCGQEAITATLKNELKTGRLSHAYLFTGSRGTGKTTCAKILAKAANCLHPVDGDPCNECEICQGIEKGTVLDIEEIDAASNNGVDNIRALREEVHFTPTAGKYRVYIIDEVHMLSVGAFNALLKTLEEPPEHVIFVLATTEVHKVPATVLSRCQRFDFGRISDQAIVSRLLYVAGQESFTLSEEAAVLIARLAEGGMRDALSILDRCAGVDHISVERVNDIVGLVGNAKLFTLTKALFAGHIPDCLKVVEELYQNTSDLTRLCDQLLHHFRNVMLAKAVENPKNLIVGSGEEIRQYMNIAMEVSMEQIMQVLNALQTARERMRLGAHQRVELEMALLSLQLQGRSQVQSQKSLQSATEPMTVTPAIASKPESPVTPPTPMVATPSLEEELFPVSPKEPVDVPWYTQEDGEQIAKNEDAAEKYRENQELSMEAVYFPEEAPPLPEEPPLEEPVSVVSAKVAMEAVSPTPSPNGLPYFSPWPQVIDALASKNRLMAATLKGSDAFLDGGIVLIRSQNAQFVDLIRQAGNRADVRDAIEKVTGQVYRLGPYKEKQVIKTDPLQAFVANMQGKVATTDLDAPLAEQN